ncbi:unnamed protein product [Ambrosiozyma monospora]|uniref:Unnamed protein product n=1 Tax=Ambrosiozyma monospora TaxID=43982 RepID=A0ACB5SYU5_AMBMO|nr:unnamed protein product [Ambrosiozyma monospora]
MELPDAYIMLFCHVPFPSSEYFRCLSKRKILLDGMLGANQIGFQSYSFARHMISCSARLLGYEVSPTSVKVHSTEVKIGVFPLGIDVDKLEQEAFSQTTDEMISKLRALNGNRKIIIGRDRLDYVRGVVQKLQAFEMFLDMYPEWRNKVVLIQVSFKPFYHSSRLDKEVSELVNNINGKYGNLSFQPVQLYNMRIDRQEYHALLKVADLCLITSIRDGMNTTALEYIVCQKERRSPLILSEFSGTTSVLQDSIQVNPWDSVGVANAIHDGLMMTDDLKKSLEAKLYRAVAKNTIQDWTSNNLQSLLSFVSKLSSHGTPYLNKPLLLKNYNSAQRRLFLFDYDGTLTPIVRDPAAAIPSARLNNILKELVKDPKNECWIISGRDQEFLEKWIGSNYPQIGLSAEHGCFVKRTGCKQWTNLAASFDMSWQSEVEAIFQHYTDRTPGTFIEKKKVALTWHYRKADPELGQFQADRCKNELIAKLQKFDLEVMSGKANLEVRPSFVNKGEIVKRLVLWSDPVTKKPRSASEYPDFVMCLGDDTTDEDMFRALNNIETDWTTQPAIKMNECGNYGMYPVTVGPANKVTCAKAYLSDPSQVLDTLGLFVGQVSLFETAGTVELDDRGHLCGSVASVQSMLNKVAYNEDKIQDILETDSGSSSDGSPAPDAAEVKAIVDKKKQVLMMKNAKNSKPVVDNPDLNACDSSTTVPA